MPSGWYLSPITPSFLALWSRCKECVSNEHIFVEKLPGAVSRGGCLVFREFTKQLRLDTALGRRPVMVSRLSWAWVDGQLGREVGPGKGLVAGLSRLSCRRPMGRATFQRSWNVCTASSGWCVRPFSAWPSMAASRPAQLSGYLLLVGGKGPHSGVALSPRPRGASNV